MKKSVLYVFLCVLIVAGCKTAPSDKKNEPEPIPAETVAAVAEQPASETETTQVIEQVEPKPAPKPVETVPVKPVVPQKVEADRKPVIKPPAKQTAKAPAKKEAPAKAAAKQETAKKEPVKKELAKKENAKAAPATKEVPAKQVAKAPAKKEAPAKAAAKQETAKKEPVKKELAKKENAKAAPAKKEIPAKQVAKAPVKKEPPAKAAVKQETAKKEPVKKELAKKESAKAAPAKKEAPAKQVAKAPAKKETPAKAAAKQETAKKEPVKKELAKKENAKAAPAKKEVPAKQVAKAPAKKETPAKAAAKQETAKKEPVKKELAKKENAKVAPVKKEPPTTRTAKVPAKKEASAKQTAKAPVKKEALAKQPEKKSAGEKAEKPAAYSASAVITDVSWMIEQANAAFVSKQYKGEGKMFVTVFAKYKGELTEKDFQEAAIFSPVDAWFLNAENAQTLIEIDKERKELMLKHLASGDGEGSAALGQWHVSITLVGQKPFEKEITVTGIGGQMIGAANTDKETAEKEKAKTSFIVPVAKTPEEQQALAFPVIQSVSRDSDTIEIVFSINDSRVKNAYFYFDVPKEIYYRDSGSMIDAAGKPVNGCRSFSVDGQKSYYVLHKDASNADWFDKATRCFLVVSDINRVASPWEERHRTISAASPVSKNSRLNLAQKQL